MPKLGLPFEYQKFPEYFDAINVNETTDNKNVVIEQLLKAHQVNTVLDMTCGTGSQVFYLAKQGYQVVGSDFSPALLAIARQKAKAQKIPIQFIDGDVRNLKVGAFDAVITMCNAVGHLTKTGFAKALKNISANLHEGGIYIFDILNSQAMSDKTVADLSYHVHKKLKSSQIHLVQCSVMDKNQGQLIVYDEYIIQKNAEKPQIYSDKCRLQIYTAKELRDLLAQNNFITIAQYDINGAPFITGKSLNILTVARFLGK